ncbi:bifunctional adenosylcobinamide kinase/adenosylcobinamide-phosphate guanylyltransferase [Lachnospiraceae bacterium C1.1]|nr:bifunctional adenosylcobinamide kinase/adenosylcobinamide-phosphate guanylyltransferase [Lachnospiraceae bacterium C1.1]
MFYLVCGGSGSGKSEYAEKIAVELHKNSANDPFIYIATMMAADEEAKKKIMRHREMRKNKGFKTIEAYLNLKETDIPDNCTILLDCLSNLLANEMFASNGSGENAVEEIRNGIDHLLDKAENLVIVSNDIFSDGNIYDEMTRKYISNMGKINQCLAEKADKVLELVCGIPIYHK